MSILNKLMILCITMIFLAVQAQAFPQASKTPAAEASGATIPTPSINKGTVVETMNAAGYTYLQLEKDGQKHWVAIPESQVKVGDEVELGAGMEMHNFQSKTLNRTFETIIFSQGLVKH